MTNSSFIVITLILMYYLFTDVIVFTKKIYRALSLALWRIRCTEKLLSIYKTP